MNSFIFGGVYFKEMISIMKKQDSWAFFTVRFPGFKSLEFSSPMTDPCDVDLPRQIIASMPSRYPFDPPVPAPPPKQWGVTFALNQGGGQMM